MELVLERRGKSLPRLIEESNSRMAATCHSCCLATGLLLALACIGKSTDLEKEFVRLFNGKNLSGWQEVQGKPGSFRVQDGVIVGKRDRKTGSAYWLSTNRKYRNFELRLEYWLPRGGNSGVFIRVPGYTGRTSREGMEIQLMDDGGKGKPHVGSTGSIYQVVAPSELAARPAGEWNQLRIVCNEQRVQVALNEKQVLDAAMDAFEALKNRPREGYIGLSAHTDIVRFRNVELREITASKD